MSGCHVTVHQALCQEWPRPCTTSIRERISSIPTWLATEWCHRVSNKSGLLWACQKELREQKHTNAHTFVMKKQWPVQKMSRACPSKSTTGLNLSELAPWSTVMFQGQRHQQTGFQLLGRTAIAGKESLKELLEMNQQHHQKPCFHSSSTWSIIRNASMKSWTASKYHACNY